MTGLLTVNEHTVLVEQVGGVDIVAHGDIGSVLVERAEVTEVITAAAQGPPGFSDLTQAFLIVNRLGEIATSPAAQLQAQENIGLGLIDPLAYYILAKS